MKAYFTAREIAAAGVPDLPSTERGIVQIAEKQGWRANSSMARRAAGKTRPVWEYHVSLLPPAAQARLIMIHSAPANDDQNKDEAEREALWARFNRLSKAAQERVEGRLNAVVAITDLVAGGTSASAAVSQVARQTGFSARTLFTWRETVRGVDRSDWLAALAPQPKETGDFAVCHDDAWSAIKSDYLRPEKPTFSACYRRVAKVAKSKGWPALPSERALRRRIEAEVPKAVRMLAREGRDKAKTVYPAQRRSRAHLHAMQAVNMDGHRIDVFVRLTTGKITRMQLIALQDLYSGKFVAHRLAETENKEAVRLVIGDMVEQYGIPDAIYLDNGRAFASKWISGGAPNRYRFKVREEDPQGLLVTLGIAITWTKPYSGQSKPIERAFLDLTDSIARHPACAGAYTGNKPDAKPENYASRAVDIETFRRHVDRQIAEHNAQSGRSLKACKGGSFDDAFTASMAEPGTIVRWPTKAQRAIWLLAADNIRAKKGSGEIHLHGNRFWARELNGYAGKTVTIRFDPDNLHRDIKVYDVAGAFVCDAACIADTGFDDVDAARSHNRKRADLLKAVAEQKRLHAEMTAEQLAALYSEDDAPLPDNNARPARVHRLATQATGSGLALDWSAETPSGWTDQSEEDFSNALRLIGGDNVLSFPDQSGPGGENAPMCIEYGDKKKGGHSARPKKKGP